jgi:hypothetical protein
MSTHCIQRFTHSHSQELRSEETEVTIEGNPQAMWPQERSDNRRKIWPFTNLMPGNIRPSTDLTSMNP